MKKLWFLVLFLPFFLISCSGEPIPTIDDSEAADIEDEARRRREDQEVETSKVSDYNDDIEAINAYIRRLTSFENYEQVSEGLTETAFVDQKIYAKVTKNGLNYTLLSKTNSSMKDQYHEANFTDTVKYRNSEEDEYTDCSIGDYKKVYGVTPYDNTLFDYVINKDTVKEISREKVDDNYKFTIKLDPENENTAKYLKIQMQNLSLPDMLPAVRWEEQLHSRVVIVTACLLSQTDPQVKIFLTDGT